jgi:hypothetical protein
MLESIHEYALERLIASGEDEAIRQQHAVYYLTLAEAAEQQLYGSAQRIWLKRLEIEHDNMRAALEWFRMRADGERLARLSAALAWFWWLHGHLSEARSWAEQVLARRSQLPAPVLAKALFECVQFYDGVEVGFALLDESLALYRTLGDQRGIARGLVGLGIGRYFNGDDPAARAARRRAGAVPNDWLQTRYCGCPSDVGGGRLSAGRLRASSNTAGGEPAAVSRTGEQL